MRKIKINFSEDMYKCEYPWEENILIQGGRKGLVLSKENSYSTAYFEAFPKNPKTFIRGEGQTLEEAEEKAWNKLQKYLKCENHEFIRKGYKNGAGFCKHCGLFKSDAFEPDEFCKYCNSRTYHIQNKYNEWICKDCFDQEKYTMDELNDYTIDMEAMGNMFEIPIDFNLCLELVSNNFITIDEVFKTLDKNKNIFVLEFIKRKIKKNEIENNVNSLMEFMERYYGLTEYVNKEKN